MVVGGRGHRLVPRLLDRRTGPGLSAVAASI